MLVICLLSQSGCGISMFTIGAKKKELQQNREALFKLSYLILFKEIL